MDRKLLILIGKKCSEIRKFCNYTQKELAIRFKISESQIANFEYGRLNNAILYHSYLELYKEYKKLYRG